MEWLDLLYDICKLCLLPLLVVLSGYFIKFIKTKENEINMQVDNDLHDKYVSMLSETITECVSATTQTYVDSLKQAGKFDAEAQKEAFNKTFYAVMGVLTEDAKDYLATIYGDLTVYVTNRIESEVRAQK